MLDTKTMLTTVHCIGSFMLHGSCLEMIAKTIAGCGSVMTSRSWYGIVVICNSNRLEVPKAH